MFNEALFPCALQLQIDQVEIGQDETVVDFLSSTETRICCPHCGARATRINSRYRRHPADLSCLGYAVRLSLLVRRFFCDNTDCRCRTFAERFPGLLPPYSRRISRLARREQ